MPNRSVLVRATPIELAQLLKFAGLAPTGGAAKHAIVQGEVTVNGDVERRKGRKLEAGDRVAYRGETVIVAID